MDTRPTRSCLHPNELLRFYLTCHQSIPHLVRFQEVSGSSRIEMKQTTTHTSYHVATMPGVACANPKCPSTSIISNVVVTVARIPITIIIPLVVDLDVVATVVSDVVA